MYQGMNIQSVSNVYADGLMSLFATLNHSLKSLPDSYTRHLFVLMYLHISGAGRGRITIRTSREITITYEGY
jgi:hypothetical protein